MFVVHVVSSKSPIPSDNLPIESSIAPVETNPDNQTGCSLHDFVKLPTCFGPINAINIIIRILFFPYFYFLLKNFNVLGQFIPTSTINIPPSKSVELTA